MADPIFKPDADFNILEHVHEGTKVFDANNRELGTVDRVFLGEQDAHAPTTVQSATLIPSPNLAPDFPIGVLQRVFGQDELPETLRNRLLQHGFVHVNVPGLLRPNRYVLPDQITQVTNEGIVLKATKEELIKE